MQVLISLQSPSVMLKWNKSYMDGGKSMKKQLLSFFLGGALMVCTLGGCAGSPAPAESTTPTAPEGTAQSTAESAPTETATTSEATVTDTTSTSATTAKQTTKTETKAPTKATTTGTKAAPTVAPTHKSIKLLSIGHSFSGNVMDSYLWPLFEAGGYDEIVLGYLYYPGCSLERHWDYISNNKNEYERYSKNTFGRWVNTPNPTAAEVIANEDWDYITFQASPDYAGGIECCRTYDEYAHINNLVDWAYENATNPNVKVLYHLIWSFSKDCKLWSYEYHNYNQVKQYDDFVAATKKYVLVNPKIKGMIPAGTAIQNARSTYLRDSFNNPGTTGDGYHLNDRGCFVAALTWYCYLSGTAAADNTYCPQKYKADYTALADAVDNALKTPFEFTISKYSTYPKH